MKSWLPCRNRLAVCVGVLLLQAVRAAAQPSPLLFSPPGREALVRPAPAAGPVVRERTATVGRGWLDRALARPDDTAPFRLNLFADTVLSVRADGAEIDRTQRRSWTGTVPGDPASTVVVTWQGDAVLGRVQAHGRTYAIDPAGAGRVRIRELDARVVDDDALVMTPPARTARPSLATAIPGTPVVDVLVLYTPAAASRAGGTLAIELSIANSVAATNTAFRRSGVEAELRLATVRPLFYVESLGGIGVDLFEIGTSGSMGALVDQMRQEAGADLVALVTGRAIVDGGCGTSWLGPSPAAIHSVTEEGCLFAGQWSFSHEIGHNFGGDHAPGDPIVSTVPYARGYRDAQVRTLMAYPVPGAPLRSLNYSSRSVLEPTGVGGRTGSPLQDNARQFNEAAATLAGFSTPAAAPQAPTGLAATVTGRTVTLIWTPAPAGGPITAYELHAGTVPGGSDVGLFVLPTSTSPFTFTDVGPGRYYARLRSRGPGGVSAPSAEIVVDVGPLCLRPGPATIAASVAGGVVSLQWSAPAGTGATSFLLGVGHSPGTYDLGVVDVGGLTDAAVPAPPGQYFVQAAGRNACGLGVPSPALAVVVR